MVDAETAALPWLDVLLHKPKGKLLFEKLSGFFTQKFHRSRQSAQSTVTSKQNWPVQPQPHASLQGSYNPAQKETFVHSPTSFKIFEKLVPSVYWSGLCLPNTIGYFLEKKTLVQTPFRRQEGVTLAPFSVTVCKSLGVYEK